MEFESPDVMKDFPGLYGSDGSKKNSNEAECKKKDKKEKEKGYAALEGESSAEEETKSPSKTKKAKAFKFSTKSKDKREKSKEKDIIEKKKDKKAEKKVEKEKVKTDKKEKKENGDIADELPIFGVNLDLTIERSRCHDGINIPLPVRECIDYLEAVGLVFEGVYKISGTKSKVVQIKKLYNQRTLVSLAEYDVPTITSLLKMYLRDLPEPVFTADLLIRFEEAGAILNIGTREKHLKILADNLPPNNRMLLSWLLIHFDNVILNERHNKMNMQHFVPVLSPVIHTSQRLLTALLHHCRALFPTVVLEPYIPPIRSTSLLPEDQDSLEIELRKQESLLSQIHSEINSGFIFKTREELLWEVQRIITQLKRKIKNLQKDSRSDEKKSTEAIPELTQPQIHLPPPPPSHSQDIPSELQSKSDSDSEVGGYVEQTPLNEKAEINKQIIVESEQSFTDASLNLLRLKTLALINFKDRLINEIDKERCKIESLQMQLNDATNTNTTNATSNVVLNDSENLDEVMDLLHKENQILQIKKINLVREIMEEEEICIDLEAKLSLLNN